MDSKVVPSWDLSHIFNSKKAYEKEKSSLIERVKKFHEKYRKNLKEKKLLLNAMEDFEEISQSMSKIVCYVNLKKTIDQSDHELIKECLSVAQLSSECEALCEFFSLEINSMTEEDITLQSANNDRLQKFLPFIKKIRSFKDYQLSEDIEITLIKKNLTSKNGWQNLFHELHAEIRYPFQNKMLNLSEIKKLQSDRNASVRKESFESITNVLSKHSTVLTSITNNIAKDKVTTDAMRGIKDPMLQANLNNMVKKKTVDILHATVKKNYNNISERYFNIKAKILGKDKLEFYDKYQPLSLSESTEKYSWDKTKEIILQAYKDFDEEFYQICNDLYSKNLIDAKILPNKSHGAFCCFISPQIDPYIMVNFSEKNSDVFTLAHELGHAIHFSIISKRNKEKILSESTLVLSESASIFGERLIFDLMIRQESDPKIIIEMIAKKIEDYIGTTVMQIAYSNFEIELHERAKTSYLSSEEINEIWLKTQKQAYGNSLNISNDVGYLWSYIPHFIDYQFYVYSYSFASCLVNSIYSMKEKFQDSFVSRYKSFLAESCLTEPEPLLMKHFEIDMETDLFWQSGLDSIINLIDLLEETCKKQKII